MVGFKTNWSGPKTPIVHVPTLLLAVSKTWVGQVPKLLLVRLKNPISHVLNSYGQVQNSYKGRVQKLLLLIRLKNPISQVLNYYWSGPKLLLVRSKTLNGKVQNS